MYEVCLNDEEETPIIVCITYEKACEAIQTMVNKGMFDNEDDDKVTFIVRQWEQEYLH